MNLHRIVVVGVGVFDPHSSVGITIVGGEIFAGFGAASKTEQLVQLCLVRLRDEHVEQRLFCFAQCLEKGTVHRSALLQRKGIRLEFRAKSKHGKDNFRVALQVGGAHDVL